MNIIAIIPARGGSKGIPRKNIKEINGKPLISYTIAEAKKSHYINRIIVSTEDEEIAQISQKYGGEVPFLRPRELAEDNTPGIDPIIHCINWLKENENYDPEYVCLLQCTSPFRKFNQINEAIERLISENADSIVSVCESEISPYWMKKINDGKMQDFMDDIPFYARRQDVPKVYRLNGAIYIAKTSVLLAKQNWYTESTLAYVMDRNSSIDIDDMTDFKFAEYLMKENKND
ncbi:MULTISPECIES: acylneuraminate cytidylyltransferase family protein [unclassified Clostridium]|uniref:acylneuraminate cytidylyltransferase family protein n=1 Tax=unclassified Clostridium TaxID=2614128 RepID=UPI000297E080|nr:MULTISPECIES: acylneuraminate cytidylyltransferase family protein [unclassified Clostridium]EKQ51122.1 MAG: CMP-N-acetylneuraminic acid synthetase [Clostridium sp. Maddingley MBC34-26]